jgi:isopentenyl diphosphate isomerase/L-lactate dehydrogenase-like FMN-dependent dehydrogenase
MDRIRIGVYTPDPMRTALASVEMFRRKARRVLPRVLFDYVDGGAEDEVAMARNRRRFQDLVLQPHQAVSTDAPDLTTTVLGQPVSLPVLLAPCGMARLVHPDGEPGVARAAQAAGTISVVSSASGYALEDVAAAATNAWFQLYFLGGRDGAAVLVDRARAAGFGALVVTVDTAALGKRDRDLAHGFNGALRRDLQNALRFGPDFARHPRWLYRFARDGLPVELGNLARLGPAGEAVDGTRAAAALVAHPPTWTDLEWLREAWPGHLVIKGVLSGADAGRAAALGADAVVVSNHGGRQLDSAPATIEVLPEIVDAVGSSLEVLLDSGVRRGSDVAKAVALGARAVLVGRPWVYGLAVGGEAGVASIIQILRSELAMTLRLLGASSVHDLEQSWVWEPDSRPPRA